jgi:hypothetical protein
VTEDPYDQDADRGDTDHQDLRDVADEEEGDGGDLPGRNPETGR